MPMPFANHIGAKVVEAHDGGSLLSVSIEDHHFNLAGAVHGGVLFTLADTGMGAALHSTFEANEFCATVEIKINYFRPVTAGELKCKSTLAYKGKSLASIESTIWSDDSVVAKANGTFAIFAKRMTLGT